MFRDLWLILTYYLINMTKITFKDLQGSTKHMRRFPRQPMPFNLPDSVSTLFSPQEYLKKKLSKLSDFFRNNNIDTVVVGISGGIDSALVFYLMDRLKGQGVLREVCPISMPILNAEGVTNQFEAAQRARLVMESLDYEYYEVELSNAYNAIVRESADVFEKREWAEGQMASVLRTPVLYYHAAMLQTAGRRSIVVGTTNRDEGSYIGFFGKASDGMVDLQPIVDIHKSEVIEVAEILGVPSEIIKATPTGDCWDGRIDEEMIGAPYWFLEMYLILKERNLLNLFNNLVDEELEAATHWVDNIETLHRANAHKYQVGSPAHFVDVMPRKIPGGWQ
jgi:NAD+ synthetase